MIQIVLVDFGHTGVRRDELARVAMALTTQCQQHLALPPPYGYGISAQVRVGAGVFDVRPHEWLLGLYQHPDVAGALGYHDQTLHGQPLMRVFPPLDAQDGVPWSQTASHEVIETLVDPNCARCALSWDGRLWAYEAADAPESEGYEVDGVLLSDFVLPPYFEPVRSLAGLKLDWMGLIKKPLEILPGGYGQWFDPQAGWQQVFAQEENSEPRAYRRDHAGRRARRDRRPLGESVPVPAGGPLLSTPPPRPSLRPPAL